MLKTKQLIEDAIQELLSTSMPKRLNMADLGCGTGPNSLVPIIMILDAVGEYCRHYGCPCPQSQFYLNDLPGNDFNAIFKNIPSFFKKVEEEKGEWMGRSCFISAVPRSFYGRLFPSESMQFIYCANSLQWRSQVPPMVESEMSDLDKGNIAVGKTSSHVVCEAYLSQFQRDLTVFLKSRAQEMIVGGRMILQVIGREFLDPVAEEYHYVWDDLAYAIRDLVEEGIVEEVKLNSFNLPYYEPHMDELEEVIRAEGSFEIIQCEAVSGYAATDSDDKEHADLINPDNVLNAIRAVVEPMLADHFGQEIMDILFEKFRGRFQQYAGHEADEIVFIIASLARNGNQILSSNNVIGE